MLQQIDVRVAILRTSVKLCWSPPVEAISIISGPGWAAHGFDGDDAWAFPMLAKRSICNGCHRDCCCGLVSELVVACARRGVCALLVGERCCWTE